MNNYKIAKTMLILCIVYLLGFYILKFAFPEILLQSITSPTILKLGKFINSWKGYEYIIRILCNFITFYLFACASSGKFKFKWYQWLTIALSVIVMTLVLDFLPKLYTHTSISMMFIIACICNGNIIYSTISFTLHGYLSQFLLEIRGFETILVKVSEAGLLSTLILTVEAYVWLSLLAIIFYLKESKK